MIISVFQLKETFEEYEMRPKINNPEDVYRFINKYFSKDQESFIIIPLNTKNGILAIHTLFIGSLSSNIVHPREVFRCLLNYGVSHFICAHNHPSGDPTPSREDIEITKKLYESGKILGVNMLDHVIIGANSNYSMNEAGYI